MYVGGLVTFSMIVGILGEIKWWQYMVVLSAYQNVL